MKTKFFFLILAVFGILFVTCKQEEPLKSYMTQSWETTYLKIEMPTVHKTDSLEVYEDKFDNNPELIAQSKYKEDGTFSAWFINNKGERISESEGKWKVKNDSLYVSFFFGGKDMNIRYHLTKTKEGFLGKSKYDWDEDGDFDDLLTMKTKIIKEQ